MEQVPISKPILRILTSLTGEQLPDVAVELAAKDLLRLKLNQVEERVKDFETQYQMKFDEFKQAWNDDKLSEKHSFQIEKDYWEWEAAIENEKKYRELLSELV